MDNGRTIEVWLYSAKHHRHLFGIVARQRELEYPPQRQAKEHWLRLPDGTEAVYTVVSSDHAYVDSYAQRWGDVWEVSDNSSTSDIVLKEFPESFVPQVRPEAKVAKGGRHRRFALGAEED
jgi:hypothetical protein